MVAVNVGSLALLAASAVTSVDSVADDIFSVFVAVIEILTICGEWRLTSGTCEQTLGQYPAFLLAVF